MLELLPTQELPAPALLMPMHDDAPPTARHTHRKRALLLYLHSTRQQLLRLLALGSWSSKAKAMAECAVTVLDRAASHTRMLTAAVDDMVAAHFERAGRFNPMFDVQTAMEVLTTGGVGRLFRQRVCVCRGSRLRGGCVHGMCEHAWRLHGGYNGVGNAAHGRPKLTHSPSSYVNENPQILMFLLSPQSTCVCIALQATTVTSHRPSRSCAPPTR